MRKRFLLSALAGVSLLAVAPVMAQQTPYEVEIKGVDDRPALRDLLNDVSRLVSLKDQPPPSPIGLRRRADADLDRMVAALRSTGYYDAILDLEIDVENSPAKVVIQVERGERYKIAKVTLSGPTDAPLPEQTVTAAELGLAEGAPADGPQILEAEGRIVPRFAEKGYAYARTLDRKLVVDHASQTMAVNFKVDPGPRVAFGPVSITGLQEVENRAVMRRLPWRQGDQYNPATMEEGRQALAELGVFSSVRMRLEDQPDAQNQAPVLVDVQEREMRYVGFGSAYSTEDGFGANAYWGHRNLLGGAEQFRVGAEIAGVGRRGTTTDVKELDYRLITTYKQPDFLSRRQSLNLTAEAVSERPDAYRRDALVFTAAVNRRFSKQLTGSLGVTAEQSKIKENLQTTTNTLIGFPLVLTWDRSNNLLDPTEGFRLSGTVTPYWAALGDSNSFVIGRLNGSAYHDFSGNGRYVGALRGVYGAVIGGGLLDVPADKRFYAGGGGSIRGYGYQKVGPLDAEREPTGGVSLLELGAEMRVKVTENIGIVPFVEAGNVYTTEYPDFGEGLRYAAGIGGRYYTPIGPIRVDAAVPLNRRKGDNAFQLYVSIGQAF
ncbi:MULTISPECIES: autotransporter assembly complex family protein [unclassified Azospirillum]|uniref:autotransporter assembly complex protein TamA n=1 Tax=unclassified Azospirillum TaxID=2630922 RepID=UPI000B627B36|nr:MULTISPECIES: autotransporter assembly complex family protein [unclassified Azospirillum]SNR86812.1 autotransporter secretion outer membrane protein TamA [Azospirillum sp. RU38E]SNS02959.1 autotransporter secretion outer membrane protein TamA [Azospirillum sp. RU37A]